uniref:Tryptophan synthase alpha subunit n=1 Tax=Lophurella stichidiosa TaxID=2008659 RepID=UPI002551DC1E|nr:Tryptophan synthase alpha subunit [Aphanocladia stichidiosa]WGH13947.1 Tryptophan synthase alpha subunit [Aphanocladia stichidiosa]
MNLISQVLQKKRQNSQCALIPFLTAGYPSIQLTIEALIMLDKQGADIIELGIPYSDALADGPLIQNASKVALNNGVYIDQVLQILNKIHSKIVVPIIIFTYYNPILVRGVRHFIQEISQFGVKGLIIPDLPIEETSYIARLCCYYELELILFVSPTSSQNRVNNIISQAQSCIYLVSNTGVTGIRNYINYDICFMSKYIHSKTNKLIMLGFGISSPLQVSNILKSKLNIDAMVVGSAFTNILSHYSDDSDLNSIEELGHFCKQMKLAMI